MSIAAAPSEGLLIPVAGSAPLCRGIAIHRDVLIIATLIGLQLVYFTGVVASDDLGYARCAWSAAHDLPVPRDCPNLFARFVHWKLIQAAIALLPHQPWAMVLPSMLAAAALLFILRALGGQLLGPGAATLSVVIFGLVPVNAVLASAALPDMVGAALAWAGVLLAAPALLRRELSWSGSRCLLGGFLIALGYNAKETVAALLPGLLLFVLLSQTWTRWAWARAFSLCAGAAIWLACEAAVMWCWTGDPLFHPRGFREAERNYIGAQIVPTWAGYLHYWSDYLRWLLQPRSPLAPMGALLLAGLPFAMFRRGPATNLLLCLTVPSLIYLSFGSSDLGSYRGLIHQPRYLVPVLPGMALLASAMLLRIWAAASLHWRRVLVCFGMGLVGVAALAPDALAGRWYAAGGFRAGYELLSTEAPRGSEPTRICAAPLTWNRFQTVHHWLDVPPLDRLGRVPQNREQWIESCGGAYVLVGRMDRFRPGNPKHVDWTLCGPSLESLSSFPLVARREPPASRLRQIWARLTGRPAATDQGEAVELYRIPRADETASAAVPF